MELRFHRLGQIPYLDGLRLQEEARLRVQAGGPDECFLLSHDPVVTLGKRGGIVDYKALQDLLTPVVQADRGGFATWHGPGQLIAYPILDTTRLKLGIRHLVRALGAAMIGVADELGVSGVVYDDARPGVYRAGKKLGSLGLHLSRGVTTHGLALNIHNRLDGFRAIVACGFAELQVTTLVLESGREISLVDATDLLERHLLRVLQPAPSAYDDESTTRGS